MAQTLSKRERSGTNRPVLSDTAYLQRFVELEQQLESLKEDLGVLAKEAKEDGHNVPVLKKAAKRHLESYDKRKKREDTEEAITILLEALGEYANTPLGGAALNLVGEARA